MVCWLVKSIRKALSRAKLSYSD